MAKGKIAKGALEALTDIFKFSDAPIDESKRGLLKVAPVAGVGALAGIKAGTKLLDDVPVQALEDIAPVAEKAWVDASDLSLKDELNLFTDLLNMAEGTKLSPEKAFEREIADHLDQALHSARGDTGSSTNFSERTWNLVEGDAGNLDPKLTRKYFGLGIDNVADYGSASGDSFLSRLYKEEKNVDRVDLDGEEFIEWLKSKGAHKTPHFKKMQKERKRLGLRHGEERSSWDSQGNLTYDVQ